jgi:uncharacterized protein with HEPN domain
VSRYQRDWLSDILEAIQAIVDYTTQGSLDDDLVHDAVRMRFVEIGEVTKQIDQDLLALEPTIPWRDVMGARDWLAHHYFDVSGERLADMVAIDLPPLHSAVERLMQRVDGDVIDG